MKALIHSDGVTVTTDIDCTTHVHVGDPVGLDGQKTTVKRVDGSRKFTLMKTMPVGEFALGFFP